MKTQVSIDGYPGFIEFDDDEGNPDDITIDSMKENGDAQSVRFPVRFLDKLIKLMRAYSELERLQ
jgi:hypothetical protein